MAENAENHVTDRRGDAMRRILKKICVIVALFLCPPLLIVALLAWLYMNAVKRICKKVAPAAESLKTG